MKNTSRARKPRAAAVIDEVTRDNVIALPSAKKADVGGAGDELDLLVDGHRVVVEAKRELVLRCGKASITLTRGGKIILRGTDVVSRSSGANRLQGTQVKIN